MGQAFVEMEIYPDEIAALLRASQWAPIKKESFG
jgi:hypothetical protein